MQLPVLPASIQGGISVIGLARMNALSVAVARITRLQRRPIISNDVACYVRFRFSVPRSNYNVHLPPQILLQPALPLCKYLAAYW